MKCTIVVLTLSLLVLKVWAGKIIDDFEDGDFNGWNVVRAADGKAEWIVENGELMSVSKNVCRAGAALAVGDKTWTDYEFSVQLSLKETLPMCPDGWLPSIAIGMHSNVAETGTLRLDNNHYVGVYVANWEPDRGNDGWNSKGCEVWIPPIIARSPDFGDFVTKPQEWYTLRLSSRTEGDTTTYVATINDIQLCNFDIPTFVAGERVNTGGVFITSRNAEVHFDNVVILGDSIPDFLAGLSVSPGGKLATTWGELKRHR